MLLTLLLTGVLVLPMPLMGWDPGRTPAGVSLAVYYQVGPMAWLVTAIVGVAAAVAVAWLLPRHAWLAAIVALPRLIFYDFTYIVVGANRRRR
ncbi:MAG TPA: hypothetical protein VFH63_00125 [candidate division Zixibacteria bacterium]|nr:hypothetical protein [candidate division Zixibacteria bacterium]